MSFHKIYLIQTESPSFENKHVSLIFLIFLGFAKAYIFQKFFENTGNFFENTSNFFENTGMP